MIKLGYNSLVNDNPDMLPLKDLEIIPHEPIIFGKGLKQRNPNTRTSLRKPIHSSSMASLSVHSLKSTLKPKRNSNYSVPKLLREKMVKKA